MSEDNMGEMVGEGRRTLEGDVGEGFSSLECRSLEDSFLVLVVLGASLYQPFHRPILALHPILRAIPYPIQRSLEHSRIIILLAYAPSLPELPPDIFFVLIFVRGIHPIGEISQWRKANHNLSIN